MTSPKMSLSQFAQTYRQTRGGNYDQPPPERVKVWEYERDLSAGAHVASQSEPMQKAQTPLVRRLPKSN